MWITLRLVYVSLSNELVKTERNLTLNSEKYLKSVKRHREECLRAVSLSSCISSQTFNTSQSWVDSIALISNFPQDLLILCSQSKDTEEIQKDQHTLVIVKYQFVAWSTMPLYGRWGKVLNPRTTWISLFYWKSWYDEIVVHFLSSHTSQCFCIFWIFYNKWISCIQKTE